MLVVYALTAQNSVMLEYENNVHNSGQQEFALLEQALAEPFISSTIEKAKEFNELLAEVDTEPEERAGIIAELDMAWGTLEGANMRLTGFVRAPLPGQHEIETEGVFIDGSEVISHGFTTVAVPQFVGGQQIGETYKIKHLIGVGVSEVWDDEAREGIDPETYVLATAELNGTHLEVDGASPERARAWLAVSYPELIDKIDSRLLNTDGSEGDALMSLRGFDFNKYANLEDDFTRICIDTYLNELLQMDKLVPYVIHMHGPARDGSEETSLLYNLSSAGSLAFIPSVGLQPQFSNNRKSKKWDLGVQTAAITKDRNESPRYFVVSINAFESIDSLRQLYYGDQNKTSTSDIIALKRYFLWPKILIAQTRKREGTRERE